MLAGFDGVLFGREAEGVPAHGVQHVESGSAPVAGEDIRGGVAFRMTDMESGAGRIGEHVEDVELGRQVERGGGFVLQSMALAKWMSRGDAFTGRPGPESGLDVPLLLPFGLDQMKRVLPARARHKGGLCARAEVGATSDSVVWHRLLWQARGACAGQVASTPLRGTGLV